MARERWVRESERCCGGGSGSEANEKECRSSASTSQSTQSTPNVYVLLRVYEMTRFYSEASSYLYAVFISLGLRWRLSIEHETDRRTSSAA